MSEQGTVETQEAPQGELDFRLPPGMEQGSVDQARAVFDKIMGKGRASQPQSMPEPADEPDETDTPEAETKTAAEAPVETKTTGNDDSETRSPEEQARYENAYRALRRAKVPKKVLDGLAEEDLLAWGRDLIPVHEEVDKAFQERDSLRDKSQKGATRESFDEADTAVPSSEVTLDESVVTPFAEALGIEDPDRLAAVKAFAKAIADQSTSKYRDTLEQLQESVIGMASERVRQDLGKAFPQVLDDDNAWKKVLAKARTFQKTGDYDDDPVAAWHDAASVIVGRPSPKAEPASEDNEKSEARRRRSASQPSTRSKSPEVTKEKTREEMDREVFDRIMARNK